MTEKQNRKVVAWQRRCACDECDGAEWEGCTEQEYLAALEDPEMQARELCVCEASAAQPAARQYYYKDNGCPAAGANDGDCICWHDEGTGPHPKAGNEFAWRDKPAAHDQGEVQRLREALNWLRGAINCTAENDVDQCGAWISTKHPMIQRIDELLAASTGQEVGK